MLRLSWAHVAVQAVYVFTKLGIPAVLRQGSRTARDIAELTQSNDSALYRVLRFLTTIDVVSEQDGRFSLTTFGRTLSAGSTSAIRDNTLLVASPCFWSAIGALSHSIRTGENAFEHANSQQFFDYLTNYHEAATVFDSSMDSSSRMSTAAIVSAYDFSPFRTIVDVAGGKGALLRGILKKHPVIQGILYDSKSAHDQTAIDASISDRLTAVSGNFFASVPYGGDLYILRRILHGWDDHKSVDILRQVRTAIPDHGKLLIIELAEPDGDQSRQDWFSMDLLMMILSNGRERTARDFDQILTEARFELTRTIRTHSPYWIVEGTPAS